MLSSPAVVSTGARSAERRDLLSTISGLSWREGLSARPSGPRSRRRGVAMPLEWRAPSELLGADELLLRRGRLLLGLRSRQGIRLFDLRNVGFVPEVELDHHAVGVVHEDLLQGPRRHLADLERHLVFLELVNGAADVLAVDGDVVDGAAAVILAPGFRYQVEDRFLAGIEPGAGEVEGRPVAVLEADIALVEAHGGLEVLAVDVPVVERECGHRFLLCRPQAYTDPARPWQQELSAFS